MTAANTATSVASGSRKRKNNESSDADGDGNDDDDGDKSPSGNNIPNVFKKQDVNKSPATVDAEEKEKEMEKEQEQADEENVVQMTTQQSSSLKRPIEPSSSPEADGENERLNASKSFKSLD